MGNQVCFLCNKELGRFSKKIKFSKLKPIPEGMTEDDVLCDKCNNERIKMLKEEHNATKTKSTGISSFRNSTTDKRGQTRNSMMRWKKQ